MNEEKKQRSDPPRFRYKLFKVATLTLLFLAVFFFAGFFGLEATSSSKFCSSCHEMKPEYYTWKASTHNEVDCVNCHTDPVFRKLAKDKSKGAIEALRKQSADTSAAPIRMPKEVPDSACKSCHDMTKRHVTASGDLIIPHDKHMNKEIECTQCHSGVAHGKIADRKMTFKTDYEKWDQKVGTTAMADLKFTRPDMDTCIDCHKARKITIECSSCHKSGMIPKSHKEADFKTKIHGIQAGKELAKCNECHKYMSKEPLEGYEEPSTIEKYLKNDNKQAQTKNHYNYAKENTFCQDCHNKRPASHGNNFISKHGKLANENQQLCLACHDINRTNTASKNQVNCSSCHPSTHSQTYMWRERHKIPIAKNQKPSGLCYTCHAKEKCSRCHKE